MRAIVSMGLWAVLAVIGVGAVAAQTDADAVRVMSRDRVDSTPEHTIGLRVYPLWYNRRINIDVDQSVGEMGRLLE